MGSNLHYAWTSNALLVLTSQFSVRPVQFLNTVRRA